MTLPQRRRPGISAEQYARQVLEHDLEASPPRRHIWEVIAENMKDVPPDDFAALPKDGLKQIEHYVYGVPKRTPRKLLSPTRFIGQP